LSNEPEKPPPLDVPTVGGSVKTAVVAQALKEAHQRCLGYLRRRLGSLEEAHEVMQAFMIRALAQADSLRDPASVRGWLSRLLHTSIADHQRNAARRRQRETIMSPEFFDSSAVTDAELDAAVCACLHPLIATLKPEQAELIRRIDLNEEPHAVVAADLGLSRGHLAVRLHRARQALKQRLVTMCRTCPEHGFLDCNCDSARRMELRRETERKSR
jgi:RNA polymerase sigma-70 factor (ECF subfamily)